MLRALLFCSLLATVGCSRYEVVSYNQAKDTEQDRRISELERQLSDLSSLFQSNVATVNALSALVSVLDQAQYQSQINSINSQIAALQQQAVSIQTQVVVLSTQDNVVEYVDPCGDNPNSFDEVILRTSSGRFLAYFESGGNRFLTMLSDGLYQTTDSQACRFTVSGNNISW